MPQHLYGIYIAENINGTTKALGEFVATHQDRRLSEPVAVGWWRLHGRGA